MFKMDDYEDVATLNMWLNENYPMNRVEVGVISHDPDKGYILIKASVYRDSNDLYPATTNIAFGSRDQYNRNMARFYCEDVATSAIGRAIIILKGSQKTATKESMVQVVEAQEEIAKVKAKMADTAKQYVPVPVADDPWTQSFAGPPATIEQAVDTIKDILGGTNPEESCKHGLRIWKTGVSKAGKTWGMWKCNPPHGTTNYCDPVWYSIADDGTWKPRA
tara:strand:+ start:249 stop:908 length:660 start_codon:yes stop_codon:yes gene_type:complete